MDAELQVYKIVFLMKLIINMYFINCMPNYRGNTYSRRHVYKDPNNPISGFWRFSWDDIGFYDYPAMYEYIRKKTGISKLFIVAHSQGTSSLMALLSEKPEYNDYVQAVSLIAPIR